MLGMEDFKVASLLPLMLEAETKKDDLRDFITDTEPALEDDGLSERLSRFLLEMYKPVTYPEQEKKFVKPDMKLCTLLHRLICNRDFILVRSLTELDNSKEELLTGVTEYDTAFARMAHLSLMLEHVLFVENISTRSPKQFEFQFNVDGLETKMAGLYAKVLFWLAHGCQYGFGFFLLSSTAVHASEECKTKIAQLDDDNVYSILQSFVYKAYRGNTGQKNLQKRLFLTKNKPERYAVSNHIFEINKV